MLKDAISAIKAGIDCARPSKDVANEATVGRFIFDWSFAASLGFGFLPPKVEERSARRFGVGVGLASSSCSSSSSIGHSGTSSSAE